MNYILSFLRDFFAQSGESVQKEPEVQKTDSSSEGKPYNYSSDEPIELESQDRFNRWLFATRIADTIASRADKSSLVIGVYGQWGDGKTSVLKMMRGYLGRYKHVIPIQFNPWYFDSEEKLIKGFFETIAGAIGKSLPTFQQRIGKYMKKYGAILAPVAGNAATGLGESLSIVELDELRLRLEEILTEAQVRLVIMIDDIDRLDRNEIHSVLKLVRLSAGFSYTGYVLAFDDEIVSASLGEKYGAGDKEAGRNFLEKIVQVPLHLPPADDMELRQMTFEGVDAVLKATGIELSEGQPESFARHFVDGIEPRLQTPRQSKLYVNTLNFALPLLKGEVNPVDQMLVEGIRIFYPKLYRVIRDNPSYFLKYRDGMQNDPDRKRANILVDEALEGMGVIDKERVKDRFIRVLFPRFGSTSYGHDWDTRWSREKRISSEEYFKRYFVYSVPKGDVSDLAVDSFFEIVSNGANKQIDELISDFANRGAIPRFIKKLRDREASIKPSDASNLARAFARNGAAVPRERHAFIPDWTLDQAAILISNLVKLETEKKKRESLAKEIMETADPLPFAFECLRWLRKGDKTEEEDRILSQGVEDELGRILASRIKIKAKEAPLYKTYANDAPRLLWAWNKYGKKGEVSSYLETSFKNTPTDITSFLGVYVGLAWGMESGLPSRSDFERDNYEAVKGYCSPIIIYTKLKEEYGSSLENPKFYHSDEIPFDEKIAHQFAFIHLKVLSEEENRKKEEMVKHEKGEKDTS
ncbi:NTPase KAP [Candidatus Kaiserbacteria bacterium CG10_big_fil_rev_8_21_14_0_10_43_70]|uniref:NTPase KAP n=1 Tax=Candidatus Kaiserbacteria bacterium CG10_big_fil_rev_8_21_14_0_10_43_70 TaxID=1974605 RepID=A0A2H0UJ77_9BACT|nr:MAG: NTPase KAP [Candidatus Kaiserbacteria bacterium CG10_big_fil_rev_8_21_14_0_10_43_70]